MKIEYSTVVYANRKAFTSTEMKNLHLLNFFDDVGYCLDRPPFAPAGSVDSIELKNGNKYELLTVISLEK